MPAPTRTNSTVVIGAVLVALSVALLAAGAVVLGIHVTKRDNDGYYTSGHHRVTTPTRALVTDGLDIETGDAPGWILRDGRLGTLRITASGTTQRPVFVGIARTSRVDAYLRGVDSDEITNFDFDPFTVTKTRHPGTVSPEPPASLRIWSASTSGSGEQVVEWPVTQGDWSVVVMNADGAPGVATAMSVGARLGFVLWVGVGILAVGLLLLATGVAVIVAGRRPPQVAAVHVADGAA